MLTNDDNGDLSSILTKSPTNAQARSKTISPFMVGSPNERAICIAGREKLSNHKKKKIKKSKRCAACKQRIRGTCTQVMNITNRCKCGGLFCNSHLHDHCCSYKFKEEQQTILYKNNPRVVPKTIDLI